MEFNRSLGGVAVGLIVLFALTGCGGQVVKEWNLSDTAPFSAYTGKEVTLSRDVLLVADRSFGNQFEKLTPNDARIQWRLQYAADRNVQQLEKERAVLLLPAGTPLTVQRTTLSSDQYYYFFYLIHMEGVVSNVIVRLNEPGWPREVQVVFYYDLGGDGFMVFGREGSSIRPAPWEPINTPAKRPVHWPENESLVRQNSSEVHN